MGVHLQQERISYFSVPKCACTSIKHFFFEIENGFPFRRFRANGQVRHIHNSVYGTRPFEEEAALSGDGYWRIAVVRDPIRRFLSCYSNRVLKKAVLEKVDFTEEDKAAGLCARPDLSSYVRDFRRYRAASRVIRHHSRPMVDFLGTEPGYFDRLYRIEEVATLAKDVAERIGRPAPEMRRLQGQSPKFETSALTADEQAKIRAYYARDYEVFGSVL